MESSTIKPYALSATRINAFNCNFFFYQQYIVNKGQRRDDAGTPLNLLEGKFCHRVHELYTRTLMNLQLESDMDLLNQIFDTVWEKESDYIPESQREELKDMLVEFATNNVINLETIWAAEKEICLNWDLKEVDWNAEDAWLRMKLDSVDIAGSEAIVTDYKTGRYIPPETELKKSLQSKIYPFGLWVLNNYLNHFTIVYHYTRWNVKRTLHFHMPGTEPLYDDSVVIDFNTIEKQIRNFSDRLTQKVNNPNSEWPAIIGENCPICRYPCPLTERGIVPVKSIETAVDIGMQIQALKKKASDLTDMLKKYSKGADALIEIPTGEYGFHKTETLKGYKASQIVQYCLDNGLDLDLLLAVDSKKIKKLNDDEIKKELMSMGKTVVGTRFSFKKSAKEEDDENE